MPTVAEVLDGAIDLDIECVDRVLLNGYLAPSGAHRLWAVGDEAS